jgi:hypothetical protein
MKAKYILILLVSLNITWGFGQIKFFNVFYGSGYDYGHGITQLADSSYMLTGSSSSYGSNSSQAFLLKMTKNGNFVWSKNFGGAESEIGKRVLNLKDSLFYIVGHSNSSGIGSYNFYLVKTDKLGNQLSEKTYNHPGWERVHDAILAHDTTIYIAGETTHPVNGNSNCYLMKTTKDGDTLWTRNFGTSGNDVLHAVKQWNDSLFFAVGELFNTDSTLTKALVLKFRKDGSIIWQKEFGTNGNYAINDFIFVGNEMRCVGWRKPKNTTDYNEYRLRLTNDGQFIGEESTGGPGTVIYDNICAYGNNNKVYIVSHFEDQFSAGQGFDAGYERYSNNLDWENVKVIAGFDGSNEQSTQVIPTSDGGVIGIGYSTASYLGGSGVYTIKIAPNDNFPYPDLTHLQNIVGINELTNTIERLTIYPNPTNAMLTLSAPSEELKAAIYNPEGRKVWTGTIGNETTINLSSWSAGVYILKIEETSLSNSIYKILKN